MSTTEFFLDGNLGELEKLAAELETFGRQNALRPDALFPLNLVLEELFVNAVRHGGCAGMQNAAHISLAWDGAVAVEFAGRGPAFDPGGAPAPDFEAPLAERRAGGLGLHFVRQIARDLEYRREGEWNRLSLRIPVEREEAKG